MIKNIIKFETLLNGKSFQFFCENDSPFADLKEALCKFITYAGIAEDSSKAQPQDCNKTECQSENKVIPIHEEAN